jgi:DNA invertase Pin-like site-specific DNA recombinase
MKIAAYYVRVSTVQQDTKSQMADLEANARSRSEEVRWYTDKASGKTMDRPAWNKLYRDIQAGEVGTIVVWRLDRLGRTARGLATLFAELIEKKVNVISLRDGIDLSTPAGRLVAHVMASVGQYETEVRAERVAAGQAAARAAGKRWGGSQAGKKIATSATAEQIMTIGRLFEEGKKIAAIARATGLSRQTVYKYLPAQQGEAA